MAGEKYNEHLKTLEEQGLLDDQLKRREAYFKKLRGEPVQDPNQKQANLKRNTCL